MTTRDDDSDELGTTLADPLATTLAHSETSPSVRRPLAATHGRYELVDRLGEGGMGVVHLVRDLRIGRVVALKTIRGDNAPEDARVRFRREAKIQGQLEHPAVVPVYDIGDETSGDDFFVMRRIGGMSLAEALDASEGRGALAWCRRVADERREAAPVGRSAPFVLGPTARRRQRYQRSHRPQSTP